MKKTTILIFVTSLIFVSCGDNRTSQTGNNAENVQDNPVKIDKIINIADISNKSIKEVNKLLGKPNNMSKAKPSGTPCKTNPCDKAYYKDGKFEIIFINKVADWITINDVSSLPMNEDLITSLGLPKTKPSFSNPSDVIKWTNIKGFEEISFFNNGSDKVDYIYIKTNTR
jgi:hypothetical protein